MCNGTQKSDSYFRNENRWALQPAIWPEVGVSTEEKPYVTLQGAAGCRLEQGGIVFGLGGRAIIDGYFNLFNLGKWRVCCGDIPVDLCLTGNGRFHLTVFCAVQDKSTDKLFSEEITLNGNTLVPLDLSGIQSPMALLYFELTALENGVLEDFNWSTSATPRQNPKIVLVVTTFKREMAVTKTVKRFAAYRENVNFRNQLTMVVVDNGQSLDIEPAEGICVIPNANLGGAGGFSRGLLEARSMGASHCLFMDDDASIHMGSIWRSWMLLAYAQDPKISIAGAMINDDHRWQIWENGAIFERGCQPQFFGCDLRNRQAVFDMEFQSTNYAPEGFYAGWWFFVFPVDQVTHMPFPFFVRGDDVSFSLANDLNIVTLPGVASFQESFTDKSSPLNWYLDMRSHLAHHLSLPAKQQSWWRMQKMFLNFYLRTVLRFHYESLSAVNLAIEDVMFGPDFFAKNADMSVRRADLKELTQVESWKPISSIPPLRHGHLKRSMRALLFVTLNGHLLPFANLVGTHLTIEAAHRENHREVYGAQKITYLNARRTAAYTVRRDRKRWLKETLRLARNSLVLRRNYQRLQKEWSDAYPDLTSEAFWSEKLSLQVL